MLKTCELKPPTTIRQLMPASNTATLVDFAFRLAHYTNTKHTYTDLTNQSANATSAASNKPNPNISPAATSNALPTNPNTSITATPNESINQATFKNTKILLVACILLTIAVTAIITSLYVTGLSEISSVGNCVGTIISSNALIGFIGLTTYAIISAQSTVTNSSRPTVDQTVAAGGSPHQITALTSAGATAPSESKLATVTTSASTTAADATLQTTQKVDQVAQKLLKNANKAIEEHKGESVATVEEVQNSSRKNSLPISIEHAESHEQGKRPSMEDASFHVKTSDGYLTGVFDGHGGKEVAQHVSQRAQELFFDLLRKNEKDVRATFTELFNLIEEEIKTHRDWDYQGSTAVLSFVDPVLGKIFTATIGDSEATIYRNFPGATKAIPLSCVRNWGSSKDKERLLKRVDQNHRADWEKTMQTRIKHVRFDGYGPNRFGGGVNVSRAMGDEGLKRPLGANSPLIHKPKITMQNLLPGDRIVIACDGLKDFTTEKEIINVLDKNKDNSRAAAQQLVRFALNEKKSTDNITALVLSVS